MKNLTATIEEMAKRYRDNIPFQCIACGVITTNPDESITITHTNACFCCEECGEYFIHEFLEADSFDERMQLPPVKCVKTENKK